jgi:DNA-binding response OmpR family regulator
MENSLAFIIEDDNNLSLAYSEAITEAGYQIKMIRNGRDALKSLETMEPGLVILDLNLPIVHGVEILTYIRSDKRLENTRVIITTADDQTAETLHEAADIVLVKPVAYDQLRDLASRFLSPAVKNQI